MTARNVRARRVTQRPAKSWPVDAMAARFNSICPVCSKGVIAGRSMIVPLAVALPPNPDDLYYTRGVFISRLRGRTQSVASSEWAHAACRSRVPEDVNELSMLVDERLDTLRAMRKAGDAL